MKIYIIIPTYNEKNNIEKLVRQIFSIGIKDVWVLVVDDDSPDGTSETVEELKKEFPFLDVIHREKKLGLGTAYVAGFSRALKEGAEYIFEMDADFSHDPKYIPRFLEAIRGADLVLGSRYVLGGGIRNWNWVRRCISRCGNMYARIILGIPFRDLTGGFKCYRRRVLEDIGLDALSSVGYNFQIETTYRTYKKGFRIIEIPIIFSERTQGKSKFDLRIILESFWKVIRLRFFQ